MRSSVLSRGFEFFLCFLFFFFLRFLFPRTQVTFVSTEVGLFTWHSWLPCLGLKDLGQGILTYRIVHKFFIFSRPDIFIKKSNSSLHNRGRGFFIKLKFFFFQWYAVWLSTRKVGNRVNQVYCREFSIEDKNWIKISTLFLLIHWVGSNVSVLHRVGPKVSDVWIGDTIFYFWESLIFR